ncbi:MAG: 16S rRNA (cytosine(1402)-N(4))-methyltransferase RsmH [Pseudomonadota bacterium]|nr:16S rRNA (cytosine(1402)-N(4))-methyltransferase RsmH [Pseudomonadota bacterium]
MKSHVPVMMKEVLTALAPQDGGTYVDGTFGRGGHTRAILAVAETRVIAIDRDPAAIAAGADFDKRLTIIAGNFGNMPALLTKLGVGRIDGVLLDLGVSSPQLDDPARGFSFAADGPLDMRMGGDGPTAAELVNGAQEDELADIIHNLGEERRARRVARAIVERRTEKPFTRTDDLATVIRQVVRASKDGLDPATRTFMALRIRVNDELEELQRGLSAAEHLLTPGGRLAVISFHSLEDRMVKTFLRRRSDKSAGVSRHQPLASTAAPSFRLIKRGTVKPSAAEILDNPRARSARLRAAIRTDAPAWPKAA